MSSAYVQDLTGHFQHSGQFYFIITDAQGRFLHANPLFENKTGYSLQQLSSITITDIIAEEKKKECITMLEGYVQSHVPVLIKALQHRNRQGVSFYMSWELSKLAAQNGAKERIQWVGTELVPENDAAYNSDLFYRHLVAYSLDGVLVADENGIIRFASSSITPILGYHSSETIGEQIFSYIHPEDRDLTVSAFRNEVAGTPQSGMIRIRLKKRSGEWIWCIVRGNSLLHDPDIKGVVIYVYDDTHRKNAEEALAESEKRVYSQARLLQNVTDVIVTTDPELVITSWNKIAEELSGITAEEVVGHPYRDVIPLDFFPYTREEVNEIVFSNKVWRGEVSFTAKNGEKKYLLHTVSLLHDENGKAMGILGVGKDITERKNIEAKLRESELFYRSMISNSLDGIVIVNVSGQITYCGPSVTKISGYEPGQLIGHNLFEFVHPDDAERAIEAYTQELNKQSRIYFILVRLLHSNGTWVWCSVRGHNLFDKPGINAMVIYFTDETKRKATEDRLRESEERFRQLINNLNLGIVLLDEKGEVILCNQACFTIFGVGPDSLTGTNLFGHQWRLIDGEGKPMSVSEYPVAIAIRTKSKVRDVVLGVFPANREEPIWLQINAEPIMDEEGRVNYIICSFADITEQRRLSAELIEQEVQKQKQLMQATIDAQEKERREIGRELHDNISQHITTTRLYLEVAREKASGEILSLITQAHKGLLDTVNEMRQLSQSLVPPSLSDIGLVESIEDLCSPLKNTHAFRIDIIHNGFDESLLPDNMKLMFFRIIQEQINNIIRHAHADTIQIRLQAQDGNIVLTVADNGKGFEPGSVKKGLGFSNMSSRADLFGGSLTISAAAGQGCCIRVQVPLPEPQLPGKS